MKSVHFLLSGLVLVILSGVAWAGVPGCVVDDSCLPPPSVVPEPTSLALLATAIGGLAWVKFRRRK